MRMHRPIDSWYAPKDTNESWVIGTMAWHERKKDLAWAMFKFGRQLDGALSESFRVLADYFDNVLVNFNAFFDEVTQSEAWKAVATWSMKEHLEREVHSEVEEDAE